jgi:anti-sigma regulatory factor (Ser/Thr protein kinase)
VQTSGLSQASGSDVHLGPGRPQLIAVEPGSSAACAEQQITLPSRAGSAREAREFTLAALWAWRLGPTADAAVTIVSELVTNAILHGSGQQADPGEPAPVGLTLRHTRDELTMIVTDSNTNPPVHAAASPDAESGRGLCVIDALADRWGSTAVGAAAKAVWATISL